MISANSDWMRKNSCLRSASWIADKFAAQSLVPYDRPHVMEGVVGILLTARQLLDAAELSIVGKHVRCTAYELAW